MNNILSYSDYFDNEKIERIIIENEINESKDGGIRGAINRRKSRKVKAELAEEIEMSKNIIDGIKEGLDSLSGDFGEIKKSLDSDNGEKSKGEKQKMLDNITKLLDKSRESTWDINELIDDGEIDYAGFTGNIAIASARYFGVFLFPYTSSILIHKGYNYFFALVKNTIRKALVMLQLNFDQFENLIITKSFQSMGYIQEMNDAEKVSEIYGKLQGMLFDSKKGSMKNKRGHKEMEAQLKLAVNQLKDEARVKKSVQASENAYNCLDQYNNTYTKSLETLRQYTQEDVQKQLDAIKTSMSKLAGQDVDLQAYSELIIAAAEEHAFKVSSSIYNRFAKMTEVFSLPNQQKLLELIQAANKERENELKRDVEEKSKEAQKNFDKDAADKLEETGRKIFEKDGLNAELGKMDDKSEYSPIKMGRWESEDLINGEETILTDDEIYNIKLWFLAHPEVLKKCHMGIRVSVVSKDSYDGDVFEYVKSLIDDIILTLDIEEKPVEEDETVDEGVIASFDEFCKLNEAKISKKKKSDIIHSAKDFVDLIEKILGAPLRMTKKNYDKLKTYPDILGSESDDKYKVDWKDKMEDQLRLILKAVEERSKKKDSKKNENIKVPVVGSDKEIEIPNDNEIMDDIKKEVPDNKEPDNNTKDDKSDNKKSDNKKVNKTYVINVKKATNSKQSNIKSKFEEDSDIAKIALKTIGDEILKDKDFTGQADDIVDGIAQSCKDKHSIKIHKVTYDILKQGIDDLKKLRSQHYKGVITDDKPEIADGNKEEKKSEE